MLPVWPTELDPPLREGYGIARGDNRLRRPVEQGPHKQRRERSKVADTVPMTLDVSRDQRARFDRFYDEEVANGTLPFLMKDPTTHGLPIMVGGAWLQNEDDAVITIAAWQLVRFGQPAPEVSLVGVRFRIRCTIEVMP